MSEKPILIIVSGLPCTGKTTIAKEISNRLNYPLIYKDGIKEILFDTLGFSNRSWSRILSETTYDVMFYVVEALISTGNSLVIEANFPQQYTKTKIKGLLNIYQFLVFEVLCIVDPQVLLRRFEDRGMSGNRHPGHMDKEVIHEVNDLITDGYNGWLDLDSEFFKADLSNFDSAVYQKLMEKITAYLEMMNE